VGPPAKPAIEVSTDPANPANEVSTDFGVGLLPSVGLPTGPPPPSRAPTASACAPYRELIELARLAWRRCSRRSCPVRGCKQADLIEA
jgi:hypothetical protein